MKSKRNLITLFFFIMLLCMLFPGTKASAAQPYVEVTTLSATKTAYAGKQFKGEVKNCDYHIYYFTSKTGKAKELPYYADDALNNSRFPTYVNHIWTNGTNIIYGVGKKTADKKGTVTFYNLTIKNGNVRKIGSINIKTATDSDTYGYYGIRNVFNGYIYYGTGSKLGRVKISNGKSSIAVKGFDAGYNTTDLAYWLTFNNWNGGSAGINWPMDSITSKNGRYIYYSYEHKLYVYDCKTAKKKAISKGSTFALRRTIVSGNTTYFSSSYIDFLPDDSTDIHIAVYKHSGSTAKTLYKKTFSYDFSAEESVLMGFDKEGVYIWDDFKFTYNDDNTSYPTIYKYYYETHEIVYFSEADSWKIWDGEY